MESLLTISIGEYTTVEISLRLTVALISMTAVLMALASGSVSHRNRIALILPAVALGGAAWFESGVWVGWKEAFELTGSAYCVTGHLLAGEDRIIAWSLGVPAILFAIGIVCLPRGRALERLAAVTLALALATPFSNVVWVVLYGWIYWQIGSCLSGSASSKLCIHAALISIAFGFFLNTLGSHHLFSFGGGASGELVRAEVILSLVDVVSFVITSVFFLLNILRLPRQDQEGAA